MAILDLQELETETPSGPEAGHSGASKNCGNGGGSFSGLSLLLC
jgi:hypothetical protein